MINSHLLYQLSYQGIRLATWSGILMIKAGGVKAEFDIFGHPTDLGACFYLESLHQFEFVLDDLGASAGTFFVCFARRGARNANGAIGLAAGLDRYAACPEE
jgi:hypothetical protein